MLANKVIEDRNFKSSGYPKMWSIERPSTSITSRVHSLNRDPRTGWFKYASASSREEIANLVAIRLFPNPLSWGKMNHIQCPLFPARTQFCAYLFEHRILRVDKALQVIRIIHGVVLRFPASSVVECRLSDEFFPMGALKEKEHLALHIPTPRVNQRLPITYFPVTGRSQG